MRGIGNAILFQALAFVVAVWFAFVLGIVVASCLWAFWSGWNLVA